MDSTRRWAVPVLGAFTVSGMFLAVPTPLVAVRAPAAAIPVSAAAVAGTVYYVDSKGGKDSAAGTSEATAWRSLHKVNATELRAGDTVRFKRGGDWPGTLRLRSSGTAASPISVEPYGKGSDPRITGSTACVVIAGVYVRVAGLRASGCQWAGFEVRGDHNELVGVHADHNVTGVQLIGAYNTVRNSVLSANNRMSVNDKGGDNDSGAFGVLLNGDDNLVVGNVIVDSYARSEDYGTDGAAVEVYNGDRNRVARNVSRDNETFVELGARKGKTAAGNVFAQNVVTSSRKRGSFLITRGPGSPIGPVKGTIAVHNSVYLPARDTIGWSCGDGCSPAILKLRNNVIMVGGRIGEEDGKGGADEGGNVYQGRSHRFKLGPRSIIADPRFRSREDLHLSPGSPAFGRALKLGPEWFGGAALARDLSGAPLPAAPAAGAYQK
ncbi:hypothetical protein AB0M44_46330 [Streptosporangium subroseum]|uniref:hypothetical protein n=1 Tax=Streptosporangium subroseum TaxID=106412 RepID=UPI003439A79D